MQPSIQLSKFNQGLNEVGLNEKSSLNSVHQLELAGGEGQDPADVVGDAQRQQRDDHQQQQHPPEAQVLHELLPGRPEAGQDALCALQVGVQQRVALHRTLAVGHLHCFQFGVRSSVEALHFLFLQTLQQTDGVFVHTASLRQNQGSRAVVVTDVDLEPVGHQELYGVHVSAQVQRSVAVVICGEQVGAELVQQAADVHVPPSGGQVQARSPAVVPDVGVAACLQEPLGERQVPVDAALQQRHRGLRRVVDEDIGHV